MRIAKTDIIAGLPAPAARDFLHRVRLVDFDEDWALSLLESRGAADPKSAALDRFEGDGYIERADHSPDGHRWWVTTTLGNALAMASFGKPITRKTADRLVTEMLGRARAHNADPGVACPKGNVTVTKATRRVVTVTKSTPRGPSNARFGGT